MHPLGKTHIDPQRGVPIAGTPLFFACVQPEIPPALDIAPYRRFYNVGINFHYSLPHHRHSALFAGIEKAALCVPVQRVAFIRKVYLARL